MAIPVREHGRVLQVVEQVVGFIVVNAERLLLDEGVVAHGVELEVCRERNRTERTVQRERDVVRLGHRGNLLHLRDAAGVRRVGLDDVHIPVGEDLLEVPARAEPLTEGDGRRAMVRDLLQCLGVFGQHRLLDEHQAVRLKLLREHLGHGAVHTTVEIDTDAEMRAHGFADGAHACQHGVDLLAGVHELHLFRRVHLDGGEAARAAFLRHRRGISGAVATDP